MPAQLDLSLLSTIRDPELRASIERLGKTLAAASDDAAPVAKSATAQSSAKIIQFPLFPEATRPVSNDMARSALFSCVQGKDRRFIKDALLATVADKEIRGIRLTRDSWN